MCVRESIRLFCTWAIKVHAESPPSGKGILKGLATCNFLACGSSERPIV